MTAPGLVLTWTFTAGNAVTVSSGVSNPAALLRADHFGHRGVKTEQVLGF